tara:strand:+ start:345 stop:830 length:486 start_codon:yes stop_codon:yes gene_type:complete
MLVDHLTIAPRVAESTDMSVHLLVSIANRYGKTKPAAKTCDQLIKAYDQAKSTMDSLYHREITEEQFRDLGHPYYPNEKRKILEIESHVAGNMRKREPIFNSQEHSRAVSFISVICADVDMCMGIFSAYPKENKIHRELKKLHDLALKARARVLALPTAER